MSWRSTALCLVTALILSLCRSDQAGLAAENVGIGLSPNPAANEPFTPETIEARARQAAEAGANSFYIDERWDVLEPDIPYLYDLEPLDSRLQRALRVGQRDGLLTLRVVDSRNKPVPNGLAETPFDSPKMRRRMEGLLVALHAQLQHVRFACVGNEIDGYFSDSPEEVDAYVALFDAARSKIRELAPAVQVSVTVTLSGLANPDTFAVLEPLLKRCDFLCLTYYPFASGFRMQEPEAVRDDFAFLRQTVEKLGSPVVVFQEIGYPSSALNASSDERQAEFLQRVFYELATEPERFAFANFFLMFDMPAWVVEDLARYYDLADSVHFRAYLQTLGLFDALGRPKPAWQVWRDGVEVLRTGGGRTGTAEWHRYR